MAPDKQRGESASRTRLQPPQVDPPGTTTTIVAGEQVEYRVAYRRAAWAPSTWPKTRTFARRQDAERFLAKLRGAGRPDLSPAAVQLSWRPVGTWTQGWPS